MHLSGSLSVDYRYLAVTSSEDAAFTETVVCGLQEKHFGIIRKNFTLSRRLLEEFRTVGSDPSRGSMLGS